MNRPASHIICFLAASAALSLTACTEPSDPASDDEALKRQLEAKAAARPPRASMNFGYIHELEDLEPAAPVTIEGTDGAQIEVQEAYLVISALEAHLCEPNRPAGGQKEGWLDPIERLFIGTAHAHVPSSATRLGTPFVEDMLAEGRARIVGEIAPPLGEYCKIYAVIAPADDDVMNRSALPIEDIVGKSMLVRGRYKTSEADDWQTFESSSDARRVVPLEAIDPNTGEHPLELADPGQTKMMLIDKTVSPALFADLSADQLDQAAETILERTEDTLRLRIFKKPEQQ